MTPAASSGGTKTSDGQRINFSIEDLEELLEGRDSWTIFEDAEDEVCFLRHRGDVLLHALREARKDISQLHDAGSQLQDAYEALQVQVRQVAGDAAYWRAMAETRIEVAPTPQVVSAEVKLEVAPTSKPAPSALAKQATAQVAHPSPPPILSSASIEPREALRQAAAEAAQADAVRRRVAAERSSIAAATPASSLAGKSEASGSRTPPRRPRSDASPSPSRASSDCGASSAASDVSYMSCSSMPRSTLSTRSVTPKRDIAAAELGRVLFGSPSAPAKKCTPKYVSGSTPKRCPGLGTPSRRVVPNLSGTVSCSESPGQRRIADLVDMFENKKVMGAASPLRPTSKSLVEAFAETLTKVSSSTPLKGVRFAPQHRV